VYLIMAFDPAILFNEGFYQQFVVTLPEGSLLNPRFPAALSNRLNTHTRFFDCQSGALGQNNPALSMAAGYGTSPYFVFSGYDENGDYFVLVELLFGGVPGRPIGDGIDGASWWPLFTSTPVEYVESYYPVLIESYKPVRDSGGAGLHRGGTGIEKTYLFQADGEVTINDDRAVTHPWGIGGGQHGGVSAKLLIRADGEEIPLPSKLDFVKVHPGDRLVFRTAGAGGFGDPLDRPVAHVARDVRRGLVSAQEARSGYGVVCAEDGTVDEAETGATRERVRAERGLPGVFDFGPVPERFAYPEGFDLERARR
jgi:N-methylhydantoinase B